MKNLILFILFTLNGIITMAQSDVIYLEGSNDSIVNCEIIKIKQQKVFFSKESKIKSVIAVGVLKGGVYKNLSNNSNILSTDVQTQSVLYKGQDYQYYENKYLTAKSRVTGGIILASLGLVGQVVGYQNYFDETSAFFLIGGAILFNIGMPVWISNVTIMNNNRNAMNSIKTPVSLSFGPTSNGIGLSLNF
jgi:hypothetical protein